MSKVSIIIPCYNVENYIEECVESAINQTYKNIEIICIDNNSSDSTWQKLEKLKNKYPQLIIDKENKTGAPAARNKGLALASGQWLQFLDADDLIMPQKIEHQINLVSQKQDTVLVSGAYYDHYLDGTKTLRIPKKDNPFKSLFITKLGCTCSNLWNVSYVKKAGGWDESLKSSQESDLMFRLLQQNDNVIFDNEVLTIVRERPSGQISNYNFVQRRQQYFEKRVEMDNWLQRNRKEYYNDEKKFFIITLINVLKGLAQENSTIADKLFQDYYEGKYHGSVPQKYLIKSYFYRYFRFKRFQMIKNFFFWRKIK